MLKRFNVLFLLAAFLFAGAIPTTSFAQSKKAKTSKAAKTKKRMKKKAEKVVIRPNRKFLETKLAAEGFSKPFVEEILSSYEHKGYEEVLRLNTILYLRKSDYHGIQVTPEAMEAVRKFSEANKDALNKAEVAHGVPKEVIASLLWIESRFGKSVGNYHIPSVYLHIIQAPRAPVQKYLLSQTYRYTDQMTPEIEKEILARTERKALWAMGELHAIEKVFNWKWKIGKEFRGSFSGAFGMPQFLPSSYIKWARSFTPPAQPDLTVSEDAIVSVAYYLSDHGWKTDKNDTRVSALMKYNNSRDYANAILALADRMEDSRSTASAHEPSTEPAAQKETSSKRKTFPAKE